MSGAPADRRELDLVVLGATGFTGRQAAAYLAAHAPPELRWALAGRDGARLAQIRAGMGPDHAERELVVVDTAELPALDRLAARTRVLLTTVGPFAQHGSGVLAACARHGTHYTDITGETPWVRRMIDAHHDQARASGARIVPFCGFDSVPSDLGAFLLSRFIRSRWDQPTGAVRAVFRMRGGINGGTVASALGMLEGGDLRALTDPVLLNPADARPARGGADSRDPAAPRFDPDLGGWTAPFIMAPVNSRVVRRSAALLAARGHGYGPDFSWQETLWTGRGLRGRARATAITAGLGATMSLGTQAWARSLVRRVAPAPGEGPTEAAMDRGFFRVDLVGEAADGQRARGHIEGQGDPGNRCTVRMLCEAALCLAGDPGELPEGEGGVLTPAVALGQPYLERLRRAGMVFQAEVFQAEVFQGEPV